jgi:hypothetical protein
MVVWAKQTTIKEWLPKELITELTTATPHTTGNVGRERALLSLNHLFYH